jgi:CO/xanthine dehydrogenase Mo-binding subunit
MASAEARRVLVEKAAGFLSTPVEQLVVNDGVVSSRADVTKRISYEQMLGGKYFNVQLDWNKQFGNTLYAPGKAQPKNPSEHKIVGQSIKREDVAPKVFAQEDFVTDVKVPRMVHGRTIRPGVAGAVPVKVDESSIKDIPGAKVVWDKGFLGVVADKEWDAIQAAQKLKVEWSKVDQPFPEQASLYDHIRKASVRKRSVDKENGSEGHRGRIRMAIPVPCQHGSGVRACSDQGRPGDVLERHAEVPLRPGRPCTHARPASR